MFVYLDDLVIFSPSEEQHLEDIKEVFQIIKSNGLKINIEKCNFFMKEVEVLGHLLTVDGIKPTEGKIEAIKYWDRSKDVSSLRSFLGTVGYYRKFIANFAKIAHCLYQLLKKNQEFIWSQDCQTSFEKLKDCIINFPILKFPDFSKPFIVRTAAFFCVMKFKSYITGNDFESILYTDHKPLVGLFKNKEPTDRQLTNWILEFSQLKIKVQYEEGKKNVIADSLSRLPRTKDSEEVRVSSATPLMDNYINSKFIQIDGQEYYKEGTNLRKVIKNEVHKNKLLLEAHQVGHEFFLKTYDPLRRDYYWENMTKDVNLMVKTCPKCQLFRPSPFPKNSENYATPAEAPFVRVGLDLIGPLYVTNNNNQYIVVLVDYFTGWVEAEPLKRIESKDFIKFLSTVFSRHGIPELLITDNGPQFISAQTKGFLDIYGIYMLPATPYHPETNGKVENRNKEIGKYLRLLSKKERQWDEILPSALWVLRTVKSEKTGFSSFELMYGRREKQPFELLVNIDRKSPGESQEVRFNI